jgi:murein DD-endopeptidase MepM/ murein hydrolase activator NlpD
MPRRRLYWFSLLGLYLVSVAFFLLFPQPTSSTHTPGRPLVAAALSPLPAVFDAFGMRENAFRIESKQVRRNETFAEILDHYGFSSARIHEIAAAIHPILDARRIRSGNAYRVYFEQGIAIPRYLVYEKNAVDYIVLDLRDSVRVIDGKREVRRARRAAGGFIQGSLYTTLKEQGMNPELAIALSDVFAWQVDFYRIAAGDSFAAVFDESFIDSTSIGVDAVRAARFIHQGRTFTAYRFEHDGRVDYYDADGNGLRRPFLRAPLAFSRISSRYSGSRFHPVLKRNRAHLGTDYVAPVGTPVRATADGVVEEAGYTPNNGRYVKIKHNATYASGYLHFSAIADGIRAGVAVQQGDVIGYVGSTGLATGAHLCYRFWRNGVPVDPLREQLPDTSEPLPDSLRPAFERLKKEFERAM